MHDIRHVFWKSANLTSLHCSSLQRNYFSCKKQFDIKNINATYTQVSPDLSCDDENVFKCTVYIYACFHCDNWIKGNHVFVHRWRVKVSIRRWVSWTCCLTTLRHIWLLSGTDTKWLLLEDLLTLIKMFISGKTCTLALLCIQHTVTVVWVLLIMVYV